MTTTIRMVAEAAGVSPATVSRVLNGSTDVNVALRERVQLAARKLGYRPNGAARSLRTRVTRVLGIIVPDVSNPFCASAVRGIADAAGAANFSVILANSDHDLEREAHHLDVAMDEQVAGVVLSPARTRQPRLSLLSERHVPVVTIDGRIEGSRQDNVRIGDRRWARAATEHLVEQGCRRIGLVAATDGSASTRDRLAGYRAALEKAGRRYEPALVGRAEDSVDGGLDASRELLALRRAPDAIIASTVLMTVGAQQALDVAGVTAPADLAFIGVELSGGPDERGSRVTSVELPARELGRCAGELLLARIRGEVRTPQRTVLPGRLVVRASTRRSS